MLGFIQQYNNENNDKTSAYNYDLILAECLYKQSLKILYLFVSLFSLMSKTSEHYDAILPDARHTEGETNVQSISHSVALLVTLNQ